MQKYLNNSGVLSLVDFANMGRTIYMYTSCMDFSNMYPILAKSTWLRNAVWSEL